MVEGNHDDDEGRDEGRLHEELLCVPSHSSNFSLDFLFLLLLSPV
jgi:hypothetical protein